ncbi:MAG: putative lipid II flippase FtsW [Acidimicrobiaceae bacterium]|nr:putative lipid II flippase FtsW [Acidimicrobiaceae bacterium]
MKTRNLRSVRRHNARGTKAHRKERKRVAKPKEQNSKKEHSLKRTRHPGTRHPVGRRTGLFLLIFLSVTILVMIGVIMGLSATAAPSLADTNSAWTFFKRHMIGVCAGFLALTIMIRIDYHLWRDIASAGLLIVIGLLAATVIPTFGIMVNGAQRWLKVGPLTFQTSELAKLALVLFVADLLAREGRSIENNRATLRPVMAVTVTLMGLIMLQPHLGGSVMIAIIVITILWFAGTRIRSLVSIGMLGAGAVLMMIVFSPWRRERILGFLNPWDDPLGRGYQPLQSLQALASGGLYGVGLGESRAKWGFLPYAHTDFIFAIIGEELGLFGTLFVILLFGVIGVAGFCVAMRSPDRLGMLLAVGLTTWILMQAAINIGAVSALFPVVGLTLPFLSYGGSSLVVSMTAIGLLLNVARQTK